MCWCCFLKGRNLLRRPTLSYNRKISSYTYALNVKCIKWLFFYTSSHLYKRVCPSVSMSVNEKIAAIARNHPSPPLFCFSSIDSFLSFPSFFLPSFPPFLLSLPPFPVSLFLSLSFPSKVGGGWLDDEFGGCGHAFHRFLPSNLAIWQNWMRLWWIHTLRRGYVWWSNDVKGWVSGLSGGYT